MSFDGAHGVSLLDGGHDFLPLQIGYGFPLLDGGGGVIPQLGQKSHPSSEELENNQKNSCGHHLFEPLLEYGSGGHDFPRLNGGHNFPLLDGGGFIRQLCDKPYPSFKEFLFLFIMSKISQELENNQNESCDHHCFEAQGGAGGGGGGGTLGKEIEEHESVSSVTTTTPTAFDVKLIHCDEAIKCDNLLLNKNSSVHDIYDEYCDDYDDDYDDDDDVDNYYYFHRSPRFTPGISLVEVFSVVINTNKNNYMEEDENPPSSLYGTICVDDGCDPQYIYNTKREDSESISLSGGGRKTALLLTGLSEPLAATDTFTIEVALMEDNDVFCRGSIYYNFITGMARKFEGTKISREARHNPITSWFDKPVTTKFHGRSGTVTINYVMWWDGVVATVEVTLLNNRDGAANVYGLIRAGHICGSFNYWSVLFDKNKESATKSIDVRPGQLIPLSRSLVAVNRITSLKISAELYVHHCDRDLSQDADEIANGTVDFPAQISGTSEKDISGSHGQIRVKVAWRRW